MSRSRRGSWLAAALLLVILVRWIDPLRPSATTRLVAAVERSAPLSAQAPSARPEVSRVASAPVLLMAGDWAAGTRDPEEQELRNPFAVKVAVPSTLPSPSLQPQLPTAAPKPSIQAAPASPVPMPSQQVSSPVVVQQPLPLQVIGTWQDERGMRAILASPRGVVVAGEGEEVMSDYMITKFSAQTVGVRARSSQREFTLPLPTTVPTGNERVIR